MSFRRTWDKDHYEQLAKERQEEGEENVVTSTGKKRTWEQREEFQAAEDGAAGPMGSERAFLKSRVGKLNLESKAGTVEMINPTEAATRAGFWCEVCECLLKDSASYLDHVNGKKHQRALGFSMRVERASADSVAAKLEELKRRPGMTTTSVKRPTLKTSEQPVETKNPVVPKSSVKDEVKEDNTDEVEDKPESTAEPQEDTEPSEDEDEDMLALMGFGGFGTTKK